MRMNLKTAKFNQTEREDRKMGINTQASDWEFRGVAQLSLAVALGGGGFVFQFRSRTASVEETVFFMGGGLGVGEGVGQGVTPPDSSGQISYSPIRCDNVFSMIDLHQSGGRLMNIGVAAIVGYGGLSVSAFNLRTGVLFDNAGGFGPSVGGLQFGANAFVGFWQIGTLMARNVQRMR
jgi:hypothetical protein